MAVLERLSKHIIVNQHGQTAERLKDGLQEVEPNGDGSGEIHQAEISSYKWVDVSFTIFFSEFMKKRHSSF